MQSEYNTSGPAYLMESTDEWRRLELKTDCETVIRQASWAGIGSGMNVLDIGCGIGATTAAIADLVGPTGRVTGIDFSPERVAYARENFSSSQIDFVCHDMTFPLELETPYDALWARFFLEYFNKNQAQVLNNALVNLHRGGIACLVDLDHNSLNHDGLSDRLERTIFELTHFIEVTRDFDAYAGRKLYGHLQRLGYQEIDVSIEAHHMTFGPGSLADRYNWLKKVDIGVKNSGCSFSAYNGDFLAFRKEFEDFLSKPERFTYSPLIMVRGVKPG